MSNTKKTATKKAITKHANIKKTSTRKIDTTKVNIKKTSPKQADIKKTNIKQANVKKIDTTKVSTRKTTPKKTNVRQASTRKPDPVKVDNKQIIKSVTEVTEIALLLLAFGIVAEILFGGMLPIGSRIITNLIGSISALGEHGFVGVVALGIVVYPFRKSKVFA